ncbi:dehydrogenase/reductase SDR family member 11-like [Schistocerca nitens]|uniref:dehydrogenase/reductase SDR family member 11-like n=1 Tax=Schistocerca nitens TaxID=7011 RepID=UPI002117655C|nr:dehydrogenase/reductase SDR family member 11-like [Schistocerca nitens]
MERYAGRVALVTGANSGIGAATARALLRRGLEVVGLDKRIDRVQFVNNETNEHSSTRQWTKAAGQTAEWRHTLDVNVLGLSVCTREAVQSMLDRGVDDGFVIHICRIAGHIMPFDPLYSMYYASKHAVKALLEGLRKDLVARNSKIRCGGPWSGVYTRMLAFMALLLQLEDPPDL